MSRTAVWLGVGAGLAALGAGGFFAYRHFSEEPAISSAPSPYAPATKQLVKSELVKESERPADGFIVMVEATPDGTLLSIDGKESGETPASFNFDCKPGKEYLLELTHPGYADLKHAVSCKKDVLLLVTAKLKKQGT